MSARIAFAFAVALAALFLAGCTDPSNARRALAAAGFRDIEITGYRFFGCDTRDLYRTGFRATGATGLPVSGAVCSGWFKSSTIRID